MKSAFIVIAAALMGAASNGIAQQPPRPPTDNELRASYCLGYLGKSTRILEAAIARMDETTPPDTRAQFVAAKKLQGENQFRLESYVYTRLQYIEPTAMMIALERGQAAFESRRQELNACLATCPPARDRADFEACGKKCSTGELSDRIQQCMNLSWLPF
jgi:hypothetical protein